MAFGCAALVMVMNPSRLPLWAAPYKSWILFLFCIVVPHVLYHQPESSSASQFVPFIFSHKKAVLDVLDSYYVIIQASLSFTGHLYFKRIVFI